MVNPQTCSTATLTLWSFLPQFVQNADEGNGYLFLSWLEGIGSQQQIIDDLCRDTPQYIGWSSIMDISRCPTYALPWLAQFLGVRFNAPTLNNDNAMRSAIIAKGNFNRGTLTAIANSVSNYLGPDGYVNIIERYPDPYSFTIQVYGALNVLTYLELAKKDATYQDVTDDYPLYSDFPVQDQSTVEAAITASVPAGLVVTILFE